MRGCELYEPRSKTKLTQLCLGTPFRFARGPADRRRGKLPARYEWNFFAKSSRKPRSTSPTASTRSAKVFKEPGAPLLLHAWALISTALQVAEVHEKLYPGSTYLVAQPLHGVSRLRTWFEAKQLPRHRRPRLTASRGTAFCSPPRRRRRGRGRAGARRDPPESRSLEENSAPRRSRSKTPSRRSRLIRPCAC